MNALFSLILLMGMFLIDFPLRAQEGRDLVPETWESMKEKLHLSHEQLMRIREIKERHGVEIGKLKKKLDSNVYELRNMLEQEPTDQQKIESTVQEIGRIQTQKIRLQTQSIFEIRSILTPEQKRVLRTFRRGKTDGSYRWLELVPDEAS